MPAVAGQIKSLNVLGEPLLPCSRDPLTGFWRDGSCNTGQADAGAHCICILVTQRFLEFSYTRGNDLITPRPEFAFEGLKPGDRWCLCLDRWIEAHDAGAAPKVVLEATHQIVLQKVPMGVLEAFAG